MTHYTKQTKVSHISRNAPRSKRDDPIACDENGNSRVSQYLDEWAIEAFRKVARHQGASVHSLMVARILDYVSGRIDMRFRKLAPMKHFVLTLPLPIVEALEVRSREYNCSRAQLIRWILEWEKKTPSEDESDRYFREKELSQSISKDLGIRVGERLSPTSNKAVNQESGAVPYKNLRTGEGPRPRGRPRKVALGEKDYKAPPPEGEVVLPKRGKFPKRNLAVGTEEFSDPSVLNQFKTDEAHTVGRADLPQQKSQLELELEEMELGRQLPGCTCGMTADPCPLHGSGAFAQPADIGTPQENPSPIKPQEDAPLPEPDVLALKCTCEITLDPCPVHDVEEVEGE